MSAPALPNPLCRRQKHLKQKCGTPLLELPGYTTDYKRDTDTNRIPTFGTRRTKLWYFEYQTVVALVPNCGTSNTKLWYFEYQPLAFHIFLGEENHIFTYLCQSIKHGNKWKALKK